MQMQDTLKDDFTYHYVTEVLSNKDKGEDEHSGKVYSRVIDLDWVEAIEDALLYIDKAIRDRRRFIEQHEDIVPIEKARKITSESVRHLAQHTNLIASVEGDTVTPERILDIQREESFAIYENRFLHTLLTNVMRFVENRYQKLKDAPEDTFTKVLMERKVKVHQDNLNFKLEYSNESKEREKVKVDLATDVETLTDFERVLRIRRVLSDFIATPLMRDMSTREPVRPPILRTNLMVKNPNFKKALDLWLFIETYQKPGFDVVGNEYTGQMEEDLKKEIYGMFSFQHFVISMSTNSALKDLLHEKYLEENARIEEEKSAPDRERKKLERFRIDKIREEETQLRLEEIRVREKEISDLKSNLRSQKLTIRQRETSIKELKGNLYLAENSLEEAKGQLAEQEKQITAQENTIKEQETCINTQKATLKENEELLSNYAFKIEKLETEIKNIRTELDIANTELEELKTKIKSQESEIEKLTKEAEENRQKIIELGIKINLLEDNVKEKDLILNENKEEILYLNNKVENLKDINIKQEESHKFQTKNIKDSYENKILETENLHTEAITKLNSDFKTEKDSLLESFKEEKEAVKISTENKIADLNKIHNTKIEDLKNTLVKTNKAYEAKINAVEENKVKTVTNAKKSAKKEIDLQIKRVDKIEKTFEKKIAKAKKIKNTEIDTAKKEFNTKLTRSIKKAEKEAEKAILDIKKESENAIKQNKKAAEKAIRNTNEDAKRNIRRANRELKVRKADARRFVKTYNKHLKEHMLNHIGEGKRSMNAFTALEYGFNGASEASVDNIQLTQRLFTKIKETSRKTEALFVVYEGEFIYLAQFKNNEVKLLEKYQINSKEYYKEIDKKLADSNFKICTITYDKNSDYEGFIIKEYIENNLQFNNVVTSEVINNSNGTSKIFGVFYTKK